MGSRSHALVLVGMLLAAGALGGAWVYAQGLGDTRHEFGGTGSAHSGNATLYVVEERASARRPLGGGDTVRVEADARAFISIGLDLFAVPAGQGSSFLTDKAPVILAHQGPVPRLGLFYPTPSNKTIVGGRGATTFDLDPVFEVTVPTGADGLDLVWVNATHKVPDGELGLMEFQTTWTNSRWAHARGWFLGAETLAAVAALACLAAWAWRSTKAERQPDEPSTGALPIVTHLVEAAGSSLRRLRDAYAAVGILLVVSLSYAQETLESRMEDRFVGQILAPSAATQAARWGFWCGSAVLVLAWAFLAWRAQMDLKRWRAFMAKGPFNP